MCVLQDIEKDRLKWGDLGKTAQMTLNYFSQGKAIREDSSLSRPIHYVDWIIIARNNCLSNN